MKFTYGQRFCRKIYELMSRIKGAISDDDTKEYRKSLLWYFRYKRGIIKNTFMNELEEFPLYESDIVLPDGSEFITGVLSQIKHLSEKAADISNWSNEHDLSKLLIIMLREFNLDMSNRVNIYGIIDKAEFAIEDLYKSSPDKRIKIINDYQLFLQQLSDACFCFDNKTNSLIKY